MKELLSAIGNICAVILSVGFLGLGMVKLVGVQGVAEAFENWGYPHILIYIIGIVELILFVMFFMKKTRIIASIISIFMMTGAIYTHYTNQEMNQLYGPLIVIILCTVLLVDEYLLQKAKPSL
jgi:uncharacterized membrane protein YphA (DoxX/SURF4 family)